MSRYHALTPSPCTVFPHHTLPHYLSHNTSTPLHCNTQHTSSFPLTTTPYSLIQALVLQGINIKTSLDLNYPYFASVLSSENLPLCWRFNSDQFWPSSATNNLTTQPNKHVPNNRTKQHNETHIKQPTKQAQSLRQRWRPWKLIWVNTFGRITFAVAWYAFGIHESHSPSSITLSLSRYYSLNTYTLYSI